MLYTALQSMSSSSGIVFKNFIASDLAVFLNSKLHSKFFDLDSSYISFIVVLATSTV